ncbi:FAD/NAD(P)-binding protein [Amycolatopsis sp. WGS_07]|uniref:FAD/NAD(P)-binding protein n=1 Tax=Amycolatopsis sp. WGS_07 TaxID=3076764 RepID=UPI0038731227
MTGHRLVIVGGGPGGTYAMERLAALLSAAPPRIPVHITVFELNGRFGAGSTHDDQQVWTSYLNRVASQIAFASDESNQTDALLPRQLRPTFVEWSQDRFRATGDSRFDLGPQDVPRRYLHGHALRDMFGRYAELLRAIPDVHVDLRADEAVDISPSAEHPYLVHGKTTAPVPADHILLVTGHSRNAPAPGTRAARLAEHASTDPRARYLPSPYPLATQLDEAAVPPGEPLGLLGLGLTAIDAILHLTEGRGGQFVEEDDPSRPRRLRYVPSGREPMPIIAVSPSGMFTSSRAENRKAADQTGLGHAALEHRPVFLTVPVIERLRAEHGVPANLPTGPVRQLDFATQLFPLVVLELAEVYYRTLLGDRFGDRLRAAVADRYEEFLLLGGPGPIDRLLEPVTRCFDTVLAEGLDEDQAAAFRRVVDNAYGHSRDLADHRFVWRRWFEPVERVPGMTGDDWRSALIVHMRQDHAAAAQGNLDNPVKAACDGVWRDLRSVFSAAIDFGGLTARSQREFVRRHLRYYTRMSNGTGLEPMRRILALVEAGVVDVRIGPEPDVAPVPGGFRISGPVTGETREVAVVAEGRAHPFDAEHDLRPLYPNLLRRGLIRRWRNPPDFEPGGLDVTREFHPVRADGTVDDRLTVLGNPVEGVAYFQLSAARPHSGSSVLDNIARWAGHAVRAATDERETA